MKMADLEGAEFASLQGRKVRILRTRVPYGPSGRAIGVDYRMVDDGEEVYHGTCRDLEPWSDEREARRVRDRERASLQKTNAALNRFFFGG